MSVYEVTDPDTGQTLELTGDSPPSGAELEQIFSGLAQQPTATEPSAPDYSEMGFGERLQGAIEDIPRTAGLTARSAIQGVGGMLEFAGTPIRVGMQAVGLGDPAGGGKQLADYLGLPEPISPTEKVISGTEEVMTGGMGLVGLAGKGAAGAKVGGTAQRVLQAMSARPELQLASAVGAGTAGGVVKETGGGWEAQLAAAILGGVAAPVGVAGTQRLFKGGKAVIDKIMGDPQLNAKIDMVLESAVKAQGSTLDDLSYSVRKALQNDMKAAMKKGEMSPDVVRRLVDYRTTGLTPTAGPLSLDPGVITKQKNLAAMGASSSDPKLQRLSQIESENNTILIENMNRLGAGVADDTVAAGRKVIGALEAKSAAAQKEIGGLYTKARGATGRSAQLDPRAFTQKANDLLDEAMLGGKIPSDVRNMLNSVAQGKTPLTVDVAEQIKSSVAALQRSTIDRSEKLALGMVRSALDDTPLLQAQGKAAQQAFDVARTASRKWFNIIDETPALKAVRDGIEPDKFMNTYIIGTGKPASINAVMKLKAAIKDKPEALLAIKNNISQFLKNKALSMKTDEVGAFSPAAYNRAMKSISDTKLKLFFDDKDFKALEAIGRVASYEKAQPVGSAVNNSKTAAAGISFVLDKLGGSTLLRRIPLGAELVASPASTVSGSIQAGAMTRAPVMMQPPKEAMGLLPPALAPYLMAE